MLSWKDILLLFGVGGVSGAICDGFHSHAGILAYPNELFLKMAWWVPLLFGMATLTVAYGHLLYDRALHRPRTLLSWSNIVGGVIGFGAVYAASAFLPVSDLAKTLTLGATVFVMTWRWNRSWHALPPMLTTIVIGCGVEITLSNLGYFQYTQPDFWGIPMWLPLLYAAASIGIGNWARKLSR
jgi:hypothetical protein